MQNAVEYNKLAITDVRNTLSQIMSTEPVTISLDTKNVGDVFTKFIEILETYGRIEQETMSLIKEVDVMLENVLSAVDEVEGS